MAMHTKVMILGVNGLLGQALVRTAPKDCSLIGVARSETLTSKLSQFVQLDLTNFNSLKELIEKANPDCIINAAAFTNVDACEESIDSKIMNEDLPRILSELDSKVIHISTDYVFDGKSGPYSETDKVNPISAYGRQKLNSEEFILSKPGNLVVRTSLVYGYGEKLGLNFHDFVRNSLANDKEIKIVDDQIGSPTLSDDLAISIWKLLEIDSQGIYNVAGSTIVSRFEWAQQIAAYYKLDSKLIIKCKTADLNQKAKRPLNSGLKLSKVYQVDKSLVTKNLQNQIDRYEEGKK